MLRDRAIKAASWSGADSLVRQAVQLGVSVVLARILSPEEFGTIALLYLFTGIATAFVDSGLSAALIQARDTTRIDESTVFWLNVGAGAAAGVVLFFAADYVASFYGLAVLVPIMRALALNVVLSALGSIHSTLLTKRLEFKSQMKAGALSTLISGAIGIGAALHGLGVWALVGQTLTATVVNTSLLWIYSDWRPTREFSVRSAKRLFRFGSYLLGASLLDVTYNRLYTVIIGKWFGVVPLGLFSRADMTKQVPVGVLSSITARIILPTFSSVGSDTRRLHRGVADALGITMFITVPAMLGLSVVADETILVLYGSGWVEAAPLLRILALAGVLWPLHVVNLNALLARGYSNLFFRLEIAKKLVGVGITLVAVRFGVIGIAWSQVGFGVAAFFMNAYYTKRELGYGAFAQLRDLAPVFAAATIMAVLVHGIEMPSSLNPVSGLLLNCSIGVASYLVLCVAFRAKALTLFVATISAALQSNQNK